MLGKTHLFYGVTAGAAVALALAHPTHLQAAQTLPAAEVLAAGAFGGLLPDLDEPGSTISNAPRILGGLARRLLRRATGETPLRLLGWLAGALLGLVAALLNLVSRALSWLVRRVSGGHREGSHWLPLWAGLSALVYLLTAPALGPWLAIGFSAGYLSHLLGDGCTRSGIPLVPYTGARLHLLPRLLRIRTGSAGETVATVVYTILLVAALYLVFARSLTVPLRL